MAGRSWSAIWSWLWPSRVRRPASVMMIWNTPASAIPRSFAISGAAASVSAMAAARALAWRSDISSASRWTVGLIAARKPSSPRDPLHGVEHELADGGGRGGSGCPGADQPGQLILDLLIAVNDQLFLGLEVVVDGLLGDLGLARHIADRDLLIPALGEQPRGRVGDDLARAGLLAFAQAEVGHVPSIANFDLTQNLVQTKSYSDIAAAPPGGPTPPASKKEPS